MSGAVDGLLVGVVIAASVGYAVCSLGPRSLKTRVLAALAAALARLPAATGMHPLARRLTAAGSAGTGACGGCDNCGAASATPSGAAAAGSSAGGGPAPGSPAPGSPAAASPAAEIRVPLSAIGKRR